MRIVRFVDENNQVQLGADQGDSTALLLKGELPGPLESTQDRRRIVRRLAPVTPSNIFCIGANYREHAKESGVPVPESPVIFMKPTSALHHPEAPIKLPACSVHGPEVDYECELAVVIGKAGRNIAEADALDHVLGYTCANDVSARRWQKHGGGGQWIRGKGFDTFCPLGPVLVPAREIPDPQALRLRTILNGNVMQDHTTADMIFSVRQLIAFISQDTTLLPMTVILTGTPQGVGFARKPPVFLQPGDRVEIEIETIGKLINPVESA